MSKLDVPTNEARAMQKNISAIAEQGGGTPLGELIQQYCPDGVEYYSISEIFEMRNGYTPSTTNEEFWRDGVIPWFKMEDIRSQGKILSNSSMHITPKAIKGKGLFKANSIIVATSATIGEHALVLVEHLSNQRFTNLYPNTQFEGKVNMFFMNYYFDMVDRWCKSHTNQGNFASVDMEQFRNLQIPVPPLPVQEEIVRILDNFTELQAELQAELQKRIQQYNYYRDNLLSFKDINRGGQIGDVEWKRLNEVASIYDGTHQTPAYKDSGVPFISVENIGDIYNSRKYISQEDFDKYKIKPLVGDIFMTRIGSIGVCAVFDKQADIAYYVSLALLRPNQKLVVPRYLKHIIESLTGCKELRKRTLVNAVPIKVNKDDIGKILLPFPSLADQQRIVNILDRFDSLTNDLTAGLPAEIEKRKQQYEYYRDKLLTFKRLNA